MIPNIENLDITKAKGSAVPLGAESMPGFVLNGAAKGSGNDNLKIRYQKLNMDEPGDIIELEMIETRALRGEGVFILTKKDFVFMDKMFMLISYIEESKV